jgi:DNA-binding NtrC family response regulator
MHAQKRVLIASSNPETHKRFTHIFEPWHLDLVSCSSLKAAREILARRPVFLVFCEDRFTGGSYHDLLAVAKDSRPTPRLVVAFRATNGRERLTTREAIRMGAYDILHPLCSDRDVEGLVIRAIRDEARSEVQTA